MSCQEARLFKYICVIFQESLVKTRVQIFNIVEKMLFSPQEIEIPTSNYSKRKAWVKTKKIPTRKGLLCLSSCIHRYEILPGVARIMPAKLPGNVSS